MDSGGRAAAMAEEVCVMVPAICRMVWKAVWCERGERGRSQFGDWLDGSEGCVCIEGVACTRMRGKGENVESNCVWLFVRTKQAPVCGSYTSTSILHQPSFLLLILTFRAQQGEPQVAQHARLVFG